MVSNLSSSLDSLVANGIIDPITAANVNGTATPTPGAKHSRGSVLPGQPTQDAFINSETEKAKKPADWKKAATAVLVAGLAAVGIVKGKSAITSLKNKAAKLKGTDVTNTTTVKSTTEVIISKIKKACSGAGQKIKDGAKFAGEKLKAMPKWAKIAGAVVGGLIVLTQTAKAILVNKIKKAQESQTVAQQTSPVMEVPQGTSIEAPLPPIAPPVAAPAKA